MEREFNYGSLTVTVPDAGAVEVCRALDLSKVVARRETVGSATVEFPRVGPGAHYVVANLARGDLLIRGVEVGRGLHTRIDLAGAGADNDDVHVVVADAGGVTRADPTIIFSPSVGGSSPRHYRLKLRSPGGEPAALTFPMRESGTVTVPAARVCWAINPACAASPVTLDVRDAESTVTIDVPAAVNLDGVDQTLAVSQDSRGITRLAELAPDGPRRFRFPTGVSRAVLILTNRGYTRYLRAVAEGGEVNVRPIEDAVVRIDRSSLPASAVTYSSGPLELDGIDVAACAMQRRRMRIEGPSRQIELGVPAGCRWRFRAFDGQGSEVYSADIE